MADILLIDDQTRTLELCRRVMPEHEWHGPARSWKDTEAQLKALKSRLDLVLLDVHFDIPEADLSACRRTRKRRTCAARVGARASRSSRRCGRPSPSSRSCS